MNNENALDLPSGFRFHPTDMELVRDYLCRKCKSLPIRAWQVIAEVDLYKFDPWQLPEKASYGEKEWYFFTPRDRKYPNSARPNRLAGSGYWKATGSDKNIGSPKIGIKKSLVFYAGKHQTEVKTDWIMHEYRLANVDRSTRINKNSRLDDWVLCRLYHKKGKMENPYVDRNIPSPETEEQNPGIPSLSDPTPPPQQPYNLILPPQQPSNPIPPPQQPSTPILPPQQPSNPISPPPPPQQPSNPISPPQQPSNPILPHQQPCNPIPPPPQQMVHMPPSENDLHNSMPQPMLPPQPSHTSSMGNNFFLPPQQSLDTSAVGNVVLPLGPSDSMPRLNTYWSGSELGSSSGITQDKEVQSYVDRTPWEGFEYDMDFEIPDGFFSPGFESQISPWDDIFNSPKDL